MSFTCLIITSLETLASLTVVSSLANGVLMIGILLIWTIAHTPSKIALEAQGKSFVIKKNFKHKLYHFFVLTHSP